MSGNRTSVVVIAAAGVFSFAMGVATAQQGPRGTPGWQYGGYNCGCFSSDQATVNSCINCCNQAATNGSLDPAERDNCLAFCNQMGQPCLP